MSTMTGDPQPRHRVRAHARAGPGSQRPRRAVALSAIVATILAIASIAGLLAGRELYGTDAPSVLVSPGGDAANLLVVLPILLAAMWLARRGSSTGVLLWAGALFYVLYVELVYLVAGPFSALSFAHAVAAVGSAALLIGFLASVDVSAVRHRLAGVPARALGAVMVVIALAAYAGLIASAASSFGRLPLDVGFRGQWAIDMVLGTPALLAGGLLLWRRHPFGYVTAPGLFLVSALGGLAFTVAAVSGRLLSGVELEVAVIAVHLAISTISTVLLALTLRPGPPRPNVPNTPEELVP